MSNTDVLLSFVGNRDPYHEGGEDYGPLLSLLQARSFSEVYLFCTGSSYVERAKTVEEIARTIGATARFSFVSLELVSVIDYEEIYGKLAGLVVEILRELGPRAPRYSVLLDPGTPQMQTVWFLMAKSGLLPATLLQGIPPRFAAGAYKVREVDLDSAVFPEVTLRGPPERRTTRPAEGLLLFHLDHAGGMIGDDPVFRGVLERAARAAGYDISILLCGETGTGKGLLARFIHEQSTRAAQPFVAVNCATVAPALAESELFGHLKGAFTGADRDRLGTFRSAAGGTVFLDEVGDLPLDAQPKLLRVLEEKVLTPVGADREVSIDVRVLAATNQDLERLIDEKRFRRDLYERLNQFSLTIPPVRERTGDLPVLVDAFLREWNTKYKEEKRLSDEARSALLAYAWPGNIREMRNAVTAMCAASLGTTIGAEVLPARIKPGRRASGAAEPTLLAGEVSIPPEGLDLKALLYQIERGYCLEALRSAGGNRERAARMLGLNAPAYRKALRERFGVEEALDAVP